VRAAAGKLFYKIRSEIVPDTRLIASASAGRKVSDENFGSFDKKYHITIEEPLALKQDGEFEQKVLDWFEKMDDMLEQRIDARLAEWMERDPIVQNEPETPETVPGEPGKLVIEPGQLDLGPTPPGAQTHPLTHDLKTARMEVSALRVKNHPDKDMKIVFALGMASRNLAFKGNWKKHGVIAYPETFKSFFDINNYGLGDHQPGAKIYADVYLKDGGTPEKVKQFFDKNGIAYPIIEDD
jgi:hypothetical protein